MEYRHLRFFIAVAEELNFTRAAERLRIAQPHLSREIRSLEQELDVLLFVRDRRRVALTAAGVVFLEKARFLLAETSEAMHAARRTHRGEIGRLRVGFSSSAGFGLLPEAIRRFRLERPEIELILAELNSDEQISLLQNHKLDASLLYPPYWVDEGLEAETLLIDTLLAALPEEHRLANQQDVSLNELEGDPWIFFRRDIASRLHNEILHACQEAGFTPNVAQEAKKLSTIVSLVASGLGVTLAPPSLAKLRLPGMVCRPLVVAPRIPLVAMWRRNDQNSALVPFLATLRDVARKFTNGSRQENFVDVLNEHPII